MKQTSPPQPRSHSTRKWKIIKRLSKTSTGTTPALPPSRCLPPPPPFAQLGLQTVPKILHFPPALAEGDGGRYATEPSHHMHMAGQVMAESMSRFVKEKTGVSIPIVR